MAFYGFARPFQRDGKGGFSKAAGRAESVSSTLEGTVAAGGELPWQPELDSHVDRLRNTKNGPILAQMATVYVQEVVQQFVPGLAGVNVSTERDGATLTLEVDATLGGAPVSASVPLSG